MKSANLAFLFLLVIVAAPAAAQDKYNSPGRQALVLDVCPHIKLSNFDFNNTVEGRTFTSKSQFTWQWMNRGTIPVVAFEIVTLRYDPFDQPLIGSRTVIFGHNSANFSPLQPGDSSGDGTSEYGHTSTYTAIAYVKSVRLGDGTVWRVDEARLKGELKKVAPGIREYGPLAPERRDQKEEKRI